MGIIGHTARFSFCADSDEARAVLQGRRRGYNLVAVCAVGAAAAAADAGPRFSGEQLDVVVVIGDQRHDGWRFNVAERSAGILEQHRHGKTATTVRGLHSDTERSLGGQQQARVRPDRYNQRQGG